MREKELILACKKGDRRGQKAFVDQYSKGMYAICMRYLRQEAYAKDALQEALVKVLNKIDMYSEEGSFKAWVSRVTVNICLQEIRKEKKYQAVEIDGSNEPHLSDNMDIRFETEAVMKFLDTLPSNYRIAINMFLVEGYSHKEIAEVLNVTESSSRSIVTRARKMIVKAFDENESNQKKIKSPSTWSLKVITG